MRQPLRVHPVWFLGALLAALAVGCTDPQTPPEEVDAGPYVPDRETWGRDKVRVDETKPAGAGPLQVGVAVRMLDGPVGVSMAGFGGRGDGRHTHWAEKMKGSAGFYGRQSIKAVAVSVGEERMAFLKLPTMSSESYLTDAIARHLKQTHELDFEGRVITMAGHSHHTTARYWPLPELLGYVGVDSFDAEVAEGQAMLFAEAIAEAWNSREPAEWAHGYQDDWDPNDEVYRDRRNVNNATYGKDPRLSMMAFRRKEDATPLAVIFNFPIHGTVFDTDNDMFTEDAPGYVEHKFEEAFFAREGTPVFGLFAQSAGGDASPGGDALDHPPLARLEKIGEAAAPKMLALYDSLEWSSETQLAIRSERIELVHERMYEGRPWETEFANKSGVPYVWGGWQCVLGDDQTTMESEPKLCVDLDFLLGILEEPVPHTAAHQAYLTVARLGDVWMMTMPGEPAWSIVKYARDEAAKRTWNGEPAHLMVIGYSQDHLLYLTAPDDWYLGGYEVDMSLWGPGGGAFFADESLATMDAMIAGKNGPVFHAESPSLAPVPEWTPRPRERSLSPGEIVEQPAASVARTQTATFAANCGDPALGSPRVRVQHQQGETFVDVPARHGWEGRVYDNSRYEMVSAYDPDPPALSNKSVAERTHLWRFYWQVPAAWPAGTYRLHLDCPVLRSGSETTTPETLSLDSNAFTVGQPEGATLTATLDDTTLSLAVHLPGVEQETTETAKPGVGKWISAGYRLLDPTVRHTEPALVRAALKVEVVDEAGAVVETLDAPFNAEAGANVVQLTGAPPTGDWSVRAWLTGDATPAKLTTSMAPAP